MTRDEALQLMHEYVQNTNLRRHMYATEAAMRFYAAKYDGNVDDWGIVGLLHDFDWEIHPSLEEHPAKGQPILGQAGLSSDMRRAIMAHAPHTATPAETMMEKCMFAVDELTGFLVACALVNPNKKLVDVKIESVKKKLKQKGFAANVNRDDIQTGFALLNLSEDEHIGNVLQAMQSIHEELGL